MVNPGNTDRSENISTHPLVGREPELEILESALQQAWSGEGSLVLVSGEAGIGKTSLVRQVSSAAREQGFLVLNGAAYDLSTTPPYGPWLQLIRAYPGTDDLPPLPEFITSREAVAALGSQEELQRGVLAFFRDVAASCPLLLVLEDLHWSDEPSLELLRFISRQIDNDRIILVSTWRDDEVTRQHPLYQLLPALIRESGAGRIEMRALDEPDVRDLVRRQFPLNAEDEPTLVRYLRNRAMGNPLFTVELLRTLKREGMLRKQDGCWRLGNLSSSMVPSLVQQMVERRLTDVSDDTRSALEFAAVIGQDVTLDRWERVTDFPVGAAAEEALDAHLVEETAGGEGVAFHHALIREAIYRIVALPRRRQLHQAVAGVYLEDARPDPEVVAWHLKQAGDPRTAEWLILAAEQAERRYAWRIALDRHDDAVRILREHGNQDQLLSRILLRMGRLLRFSDQHQAMSYLEESRQAALRCRDEVTAAFALFNIGAYQPTPGSQQTRVRKMLDAIETLSKTDQDIHSIGKWAVTRTTAEVDPLRTICATYSLQLAMVGRFDEAVKLAAQYLPEDWDADPVDIADFSDEYPYLSSADAYAGCGMAFSRLGYPGKAEVGYRMRLECYERLNFRPGVALGYNDLLHDVHFPYNTANLEQRSELLRLIERESHSSRVSLGAGTATWSLEYCFLMDGRWDQLRARIRSDITPTAYHIRYLTLLARARFALYEGNPERVRNILSQLLPGGARERPEEHAHPLPGEPHRIGALLALVDGDTARTREWMTAHDAWMEWTGAVLGRSEGSLLWGQLHLAEGDVEAAMNIAYQARNQANNPEQPIALIGAHRFLGQLATQAREFDAAASYLLESLNLAEKCALPYERALTLLVQAELELKCDNPGEARALLTEVRRIGTDLGARPMLEQAEARSAGLQPRQAEPRFGLSSREREVLGLLVYGMSDREIAGELFISRHTVARHVSSILRKLDVRSRTAAATEAARQNLV